MESIIRDKFSILFSQIIISLLTKPFLNGYNRLIPRTQLQHTLGHTWRTPCRHLCGPLLREPKESAQLSRRSLEHCSFLEKYFLPYLQSQCLKRYHSSVVLSLLVVSPINGLAMATPPVSVPSAPKSSYSGILVYMVSHLLGYSWVLVQGSCMVVYTHMDIVRQRNVMDGHSLPLLLSYSQES